MEAKDLKIGNWIEYKQSKKGVYTTMTLSSFTVNVELHFKPIPLTEEWVLKFGFKQGGLNKLLFNKKYGTGMKFTVFSSEDFEEFRIKEIPFYFIFNNIPHGIWYVHELQNLFFALTTGEELILNR